MRFHQTRLPWETSYHNFISILYDVRGSWYGPTKHYLFFPQQEKPMTAINDEFLLNIQTQKKKIKWKDEKPLHIFKAIFQKFMLLCQTMMGNEFSYSLFFLLCEWLWNTTSGNVMNVQVNFQQFRFTFLWLLAEPSCLYIGTMLVYSPSPAHVIWNTWKWDA